MMMWKIGEVEIANQIVVGPMAGISNSAFRLIAKEFGAGLCYSEMISDKAICYGNKRTLAMVDVNKDEGLVATQLFGNEISSMVEAAKYLDKNTNCAFIDINMGCPVPKVVNSGSGSALLKDPDLAFALVKAISKEIKKPLTVKMRIGWDLNNIVGKEFALGLQKAGAAALVVHGRVRSQYYEGQADWEVIKSIKEALSIPVIGNGDINSGEKAKDCLAYSGCDAVMLARGVLGNPWLIKEAVAVLDSKETPQSISVDEKFKVAKDHALRLIALKGERLAMKEMRGHACWYIHGLPYNNQVKALFNRMTSYQQFDTILDDYKNRLGE